MRQIISSRMREKRFDPGARMAMEPTTEMMGLALLERISEALEE